MLVPRRATNWWHPLEFCCKNSILNCHQVWSGSKKQPILRIQLAPMVCSQSVRKKKTEKSEEFAQEVLFQSTNAWNSLLCKKQNHPAIAGVSSYKLRTKSTKSIVKEVKEWSCWWFRNAAITSWGWQFIPSFLGFIHTRWLFGISSINSLIESKWNWETTNDHNDLIFYLKQTLDFKV